MKLIKWLIVLIVVFGCSSKVKSPRETPRMIASEIATVSPIINFPANFFLKDPIVVDASKFGCKGDAIQLNDFSINGNRLRSSTASFFPSDIGKIFSIAKAGKNGEHHIGTIKEIINSNEVIVDTVAPNVVTNQLGSYGTDNLPLVQKAFDYAIEENVVLYFSEGIYLIGEKNIKTNATAVMVNISKSGQNLVVIGAGKSKTVFRELDGKTQRQGRYTKMFYHYLKNTPDVGNIYLQDFTLDKNGRSITKNPETLYEWEQAHAWSWAGHEKSTYSIESITINNIEIFDKIGAGINFSSNPTKVKKVQIDNISESNFGGNTSRGIAYGERGDLEISCFSEDIRMSNLNLSFVQIEPVRKLSSDKEHKRFTQIKDSKIYTLQFTEADNKDPNFSRIEVKNVTSENLTFRSVTFTIDGSDIKMPNLVNSVNGTIKNTTIKLPYNAQNNEITSVNCSFLSTLKNINNKVVFNHCNFVIDSQDPTIMPKGFALTSSGNLNDHGKNRITVMDCEFDKRLDGSIDAYGNGEWVIKNNKLSGKSTAIVTGGYRDFYSKVLLKNNTYERLSNDAKNVTINNNNRFWELTIEETLPKKSWSLVQKGSIGNPEMQIKKRPTLTEN